jgi:hypothetical protein
VILPECSLASVLSAGHAETRLSRPRATRE